MVFICTGQTIRVFRQSSTNAMGIMRNALHIPGVLRSQQLRKRSELGDVDADVIQIPGNW